VSGVESKVRISRHLINIERDLEQSVQRVGRALRNMRELSVSGLPSSTPGNGDPGGGQSGAPTSSVDSKAAAIESDKAARALTDLVMAISDTADVASDVVEDFTGQRPIAPSSFIQPAPLVFHAFRCARLLVHLEVPESWRPARGWNAWSEPVMNVWKLTQAWGWLPHEPASSVHKREDLAVDLTGLWCRSCLRDGVRRHRHRHYEMCKWCKDFVAREGFIPPFELVHDHNNDKRITEEMVVPYRQAWRAAEARKGVKR
jgi:hypothetical protein